jgi:hypothetical protein
MAQQLKCNCTRRLTVTNKSKLIGNKNNQILKIRRQNKKK